MAGVFVAQNFRAAALPHGRVLASASVVLFVAGLILRWWAIIMLGRFFTVDVTIEKDHELVERGPFRIVRHPSYTGVLLAFVGLGLSLRNWAALLVILLPIGAAFIRRMNVEEDALSRALGPRYTEYIGAPSGFALHILKWSKNLFCSIGSRAKFFNLLSPGLVAKTLPRKRWGKLFEEEYTR
jgi:protein-S-isoprenylcysteine O-methyltransferase Ste14